VRCRRISTTLHGDTVLFIATALKTSNPAKHQNFYVESEVLLVVSVKNIFFWDVTPCNQVDIYLHFKGTSIFSFCDSANQSASRTFEEELNRTASSTVRMSASRNNEQQNENNNNNKYISIYYPSVVMGIMP
jgi:hypothetical protein